jgi:hypothetical protein
MGPDLLAYVEAQLLADLHHYGVAVAGLTFDWSNPCQEGHQTSYLDGRLEEMSDVAVLDDRGEPIAEGWIDFIHPSGDLPPVVFWLFLQLRVDGLWERVKRDPTIPLHMWERLPDRTKDRCAADPASDLIWPSDPLIHAWRQSRRNTQHFGPELGRG